VVLCTCKYRMVIYVTYLYITIMEDASKYKGCQGCTKVEIETVQKFLGYNTFFYVLRNWLKIKLITRWRVPGTLR
jgi:hypothetical protein